MPELNYILYTLAINALIIIFFKKITKNFAILDHPDNKRKFHKHPIFLIGGTFLILNLMIVSLLNFIYGESILNISFSSSRENFAFIFGLISFYLFGLYDDKYNLSANVKLLVSIILVTLIIFIDSNLLINKLNFSFFETDIELRSFSVLFTILCFLLFTNALNMFDGINLQVITYSILFFFIFVIKGLFVETSFIMIISLIVILFYNYKNKIFLGESGVQLIAFLISYIILKSTKNNLEVFYADEIFMIMLIPGLDMFRLFISRLIKGKHPFKADNMHLHHMMGSFFSNFQTFLLIFLLILSFIIFYQALNFKIFAIIICIFFYFSLILFLSIYKKK